MTENELKRMTTESMYGRWHAKNDQYEIYISITNNELNIKITPKDGEEEMYSLATSAAWFNQYLSFHDNGGRFFILHANAVEMVFGESKNPSNFDGQNKWLIKFFRI